MVPDTAAPRVPSSPTGVPAANLAGTLQPRTSTCNPSRSRAWRERAFPGLGQDLGGQQAVDPSIPSRMQTPPSTSAPAPAGRHLILYDGGCGFCRNAVLAVTRLDPAGTFHFAPLDSDLAGKLLAERGITSSGVGTMYVLPNWRRDGQPVLDRAAAALFIARGLAWPWNCLAALGILPHRFLDRCYDAVARNRHCLARKADACAVPDTAIQDRFLP